MIRRLQAGVFLGVAVLAGAAGFYLSRGSKTFPVADGAAQRLMLASLSDLSGKSQMMSQWRGKVLVVNFWAIWCAPCQEEIPALMSIQHLYASNGVQLVGIAVDYVSKVRLCTGDAHDYVLLIGGIETFGVTKDLGNRAGVLPFTVVLDRAGEVVYAHAGALNEALIGRGTDPVALMQPIIELD